MYEYDEECIKTFLQKQSQLFDSRRDVGGGRSLSGRLHGGCCGFNPGSKGIL